MIEMVDTAETARAAELKLKAVVRDEKLFRHMDNLMMRWEDESMYEDFGDYEASMKKVIEDSIHDVKFVKATKRPFGFWVSGYL